MCFDGFRVRSLEREGVGRLGSCEGGDCGYLSKRVMVPFGLWIRLSTLYGSMEEDELTLTSKRRRCKESIVVAVMYSDSDTDMANGEVINLLQRFVMIM